MSKISAAAKRRRKAIGAAIGGGLAWGNLVVASAPAPVTASEWLMLGTVIATSFGVVVAQGQMPGGAR